MNNCFCNCKRQACAFRACCGAFLELRLRGVGPVTKLSAPRRAFNTRMRICRPNVTEQYNTDQSSRQMPLHPGVSKRVCQIGAPPGQNGFLGTTMMQRGFTGLQTHSTIGKPPPPFPRNTSTAHRSMMRAPRRNNKIKEIYLHFGISSRRGFTGAQALQTEPTWATERGKPNGVTTSTFPPHLQHHFSGTMPLLQLLSRGLLFMAPKPYEAMEFWTLFTADATHQNATPNGCIPSGEMTLPGPNHWEKRTALAFHATRNIFCIRNFESRNLYWKDRGESRIASFDRTGDQQTHPSHETIIGVQQLSS